MATKRELEERVAELEDQLEEMYDRIGELLGLDNRARPTEPSPGSMEGKE
jgi:hypothetical protein